MTIRILGALVVAATIGGAADARAQTPAPRTLSLVFLADGTVTLGAQGVTAREILAEWARQCGCYVVNADKLAGTPLAVPVLFEHASQASVLESLLRPAAGYVLTPRRAGSRSASNYEVIYILATSTAVTTTSGSYSMSTPSVAVPIASAGSPDDEIPPVQPVRTENKPATPPTTAPAAAKPNSPGVFLPITTVPVGTSAPVAPAPAAPASRPAN